MPYRRSKKYAAQRLGPSGGRTPRDPADECPPLPDLRMRITVDRFDGQPERHVIELHRTRRIDQFRATVDGAPWLQSAGLSRVLAGIRKACPRVLSPRSVG